MVAQIVLVDEHVPGPVVRQNAPVLLVRKSIAADFFGTEGRGQVLV